MTKRPAASGPRIRATPTVRLLRVLVAGLLGVAAACLVSCGSSGAGLIPVGNAGPLQSDFEAVAQAAQNGDGSCAATEAAILKAEQDFGALPSSIDSGLRDTLHQGIANLRSRALVLCAQPLAQATATTATQKTTTSTTTSTQSTTPTTAQTTTTPIQTVTTPTTTSPGGGTPAPGAGETPPVGGGAQGGGTGAGESGAGGSGAGPTGAGAPVGGAGGAQEAGK